MAVNGIHDTSDQLSRRPFSPPHYDDGMPAGFDRFDGERQAEAPVRIKATPFVWRDPKTIKPRRWLYGRHFIRRYATATIAPGGLGKSSLELVEALAMATGRNLLDTPVKERVRVWYWNGEDPREEVERRLMAACLHYGITADEIDGWLFIDSGRETPIKIATRQKDAVTIARPVVDDLVSEIRERGIGLLILDPFVSCHDVPENDNGAIDAVTKAWAGVAETANCGVELVHHVRKASSGQTSYSVEDARGGSALIGAVRSARVLNGMSKEEAQDAGVPSENRRRFFRVDDGKANMAPPQDKAEWRQLVSVGLNNATTEDPEDWVGVVTPWCLPGLMDEISLQDVRAIQLKIASSTWGENIQSGDWAGNAVANVLKLDASDAADQSKIKRYLGTWIKNGALRVETIHNPAKGRPRKVVCVGAYV